LTPGNQNSFSSKPKHKQNEESYKRELEVARLVGQPTTHLKIEGLNPVLARHWQSIKISGSVFTTLNFTNGPNWLVFVTDKPFLSSVIKRLSFVEPIGKLQRKLNVLKYGPSSKFSSTNILAYLETFVYSVWTCSQSLFN
jgi:hypothetical protein